MTKSDTGRLDTLMKESSFPSTGLRPQYVESRNGSPEEVVLTVISYTVTNRHSGHLMIRFTVSGDPYWWREYLVPSDYEVSAWSPLPQSVLKLLIDLYALLMDGHRQYGTITITLDTLDPQNFSLGPMPLPSLATPLRMNVLIGTLWKECLSAMKKLPRWKDYPSSPGHLRDSKAISIDGIIKVKAEADKDGLTVPPPISVVTPT